MSLQHALLATSVITQTCLVTESFALRTKEALEKSNARHSRHDADAETPKETKDQKRIAELFQRKKEEQARKKGKRRSASRERGKRDDRRRSEKSRKSPEPPRKAKELVDNYMLILFVLLFLMTTGLK